MPLNFSLPFLSRSELPGGTVFVRTQCPHPRASISRLQYLYSVRSVHQSRVGLMGRSGVGSSLSLAGASWGNVFWHWLKLFF